tara:strand:+ start:129 stop:575 length:447 start_codon:yes stop_codon:yes gene_type:complete
MYCYAVLIERNRNQKKIGDKIILYLSELKIFAKYRIFGKIVVLESKTDLAKTIQDDIVMYRSAFSSSKKVDIYEKIKFLIDREHQTKRFAIRVDRKGTHDYSSTDLARNVAGAVFDKWPNIQVDLDCPELEIFVQIINNMSVIYLKHS